MSKIESMAKSLTTYLSTKYSFLSKEILHQLIKEELGTPGGDPEIGYYIQEGIYLESTDSWVFSFGIQKYYLFNLNGNAWIGPFSVLKEALNKGASFISIVNEDEIPSLEGGLGAVYIDSLESI